MAIDFHDNFSVWLSHSLRAPVMPRIRGNCLFAICLASMMGACSSGRETVAEDNIGEGSQADDDDDDDNSVDDDDDNDAGDDDDDDDDNVGEEDTNIDPDDVEFSFLWAANAAEGTVSKIDTRLHKEIARYRTGPDDWPNPSRTSVNLDGDVAVVNRAGEGAPGGVTKIISDPKRCVDTNKNGKIDTSQGPADILAWGTDECVAWNRQLPTESRPAAWTSGTRVDDDGESELVDPKLWVSAPDPSGDGAVTVYLLNGATGNTEKQVTIPGVATPQYGLYGGAVDKDGDLWAIPVAVGVHANQAYLVHVPFESLDKYEKIPIPQNQGYGTTVDHNGNIWVGCDSAVGSGGLLQRYDPEAKDWQTADLSMFANSSTWWIRGMTEDGKGHLWAAVVNTSVDKSGGGILKVDIDTLEGVEFIGSEKLSGVSQPTGVSIDVLGQVWMVDQFAGGTGGAFALVPDSGEVFFVGGLAEPYTYSDMTGFALRNVTTDPPE
jgi:hypothetical protein